MGIGSSLKKFAKKAGRTIGGAAKDVGSVFDSKALATVLPIASIYTTAGRKELANSWGTWFSPVVGAVTGQQGQSFYDGLLGAVTGGGPAVGGSLPRSGGAFTGDAPTEYVEGGGGGASGGGAFWMDPAQPGRVRSWIPWALGAAGVLVGFLVWRKMK